MAGSVQVAGLIKLAGLAEAAPTLTAAGTEALAILPALILSLTGAAVLVLDLILDRTRRRRGEPDARTPAMIGGGFETDPLLFTSLFGLASAAAFLGATSVSRAASVDGYGSLLFRDAVVADGLAAGSGILILLLTAATLVAVTGHTGHETSHERAERRRGGEFFCLVLLGSAFLVLCVQSVGLATVFVSVEALSLIVFVLASLEHEHKREHGPRRSEILRLFVVSESASAGLLLGLALVHGATGATSLTALTASASAPLDTPLLAVGASLILAALLVKTLALPCILPSLGGATDSASLVAIQSSRSVQIAIAVLLLRAGLSLAEALDTGLLAGFLSVAAAVLLVMGVWLVARHRGRAALPPAAVDHLGFLLMAVVVELASARTDAGTVQRGVPILFYLFVVEAPRLGAATWTFGRGPRDPRVTMGYAVLLLSLAGVPPLPGFWARLILFREAIATGYGLLAFIGAATTVAGLYYYLSHAAATLRETRGDAPERPPGPIVPVIVTVIAVACLVVGAFPETLLSLCRAWAG